jgi:RNA polymerase sigma factor (sigma-70 family)
VASPRGADDAVVDAFRAGDAGALAQVYARWSPLVYSLALRCLGDVTQAEEVTQRVFTRAWVSRESFDPAQAGMSHWLVDLARRSIAETRAGTGDRSPPPGGTFEESADHESKTGALAERFMVADGLSHLDTSSRRVLRMALDHDLTLGEIAGRTGLRVEEVRSRVTHGLMELRQQLEAQADAH